MTQHQQRSPVQSPSASVSQSCGRLFPTQTYLSRDVRVPIIEMLNRTLADSTVLRTHAKYAHWNVKGMEFYGLHQLFDEIAETLESHIDLVGERVTALGGEAMGTAGMAMSNCRLPAMPTNVTMGPEFVRVLADRLAVHDANLSQAIATAQEYGDDDTADLLNEISREVSQYLWFLEAHLQSQPVSEQSPASPGVDQSFSNAQQPMQERTSGQQQYPPMQQF